MRFNTKVIVTTEKMRDMGMDKPFECDAVFDADAIIVHFDIEGTGENDRARTQILMMEGSEFIITTPFEEVTKYRNEDSQ